MSFEDFTIARDRVLAEERTFGLPFKAVYSAWCPLCGCKIVKGRSEIMQAFPRIMPATIHEDNTKSGYFHHTNYVRGIFSDRYEGHRQPSTSPRSHVHSKCAAKLEKMVSHRPRSA